MGFSFSALILPSGLVRIKVINNIHRGTVFRLEQFLIIGWFVTLSRRLWYRRQFWIDSSIYSWFLLYNHWRDLFCFWSSRKQDLVFFLFKSFIEGFGFWPVLDTPVFQVPLFHVRIAFIIDIKELIVLNNKICRRLPCSFYPVKYSSVKKRRFLRRNRRNHELTQTSQTQS